MIRSADDRPNLANALGTPLTEEESASQYHVLAVVLQREQPRERGRG